MNPVESYLLEKQAIFSDPVKAALTMGAITAGTTALAAIGTGVVQDGIQSMRDAVGRSIAFKKMLRDNPQLQKEDGKKIRRYFNTLYNMSPEVAKDPYASSSWIQNMKEYDYVDPQTLHTLASVGEKIRKRESYHAIPAFQLAQGATMAGMGEYQRLQGEAARAMQDKIKFQRELGKDIGMGAARGILGLGKDILMNAPAEALQGQQEEWRALHSPQAYGVKGMGGKGAPMGMPQYQKQILSQQPYPNTAPGLREALRRKFGR